jgi:methionyl-tRNA synthetase
MYNDAGPQKITLGKTMPRKIIVTSALIYANGPVHLGHMVEYIQTDIWHRFQKMLGNESYYICGNDAHGTPIMLRAEKENVSPETLINRVHTEHTQDFSKFLISFDNFYTTHSPENEQLASEIYRKLNACGDIQVRTINQLFDPQKNMFLPDRFIKGNCPRCHAAEQYGDSCESCGATYSPTELVNPRSVVSGATPIEKASEHYFFNLPKYQDFLQTWGSEGRLQPEIQNKLHEWFEAGLQPWDISRDTPYFGFEIPDAAGKYFYVWLDAPIGYMASFKNFSQKNPEISFDEFWQENSTTELHHFIGKDIAYFHALFWPAMLKGAHYRTPTKVHVHGFLTVNGQKMSKSRGTFIQAKTYLEHLAPEYLRYYFASKLNSHLEDIDLNWTDFRLRINADLVGKYINIASRCAGFISKKFTGRLSATLANSPLFEEFANHAAKLAELYEQGNYAQALRTIMLLADKANAYIAESAPWTLAKDDTKLNDVQAICSTGINLFRQLTIYLKPVLPEVARNVEAFLNITPLIWQDAQQPLLEHSINTFVPLMQRIEETQVEALEASAKNEHF